MFGYICTTCGCQYPVTETPPVDCLICRDTRQYVNPAGQAWTTLPAMRKTYFNAFRQIEPDLMGVGTFPAFAIGQRALILRTPMGNILWDCISFLDDATTAIIKAIGGLAAVVCSHPHFLASAVEWSHAFDNVPVYLHAKDRSFVTRPDPVIALWEGDQMRFAEGINLIRCGGHFPGSTVLHWAQGAGGQGALLTGDTLQVRPDKGLTFMHSYPNLIPLDAASVRRIAAVLEPWPFETIYGGWWERVIPSGAKRVLAASVKQYIQAVTGSPESAGLRESVGSPES